MRKSIRWLTILGAAAVMTFGTCMTALAATGWVEEGNQWYYYDRYEDAVTNQWVKSPSSGIYYYHDDDGAMVTSSWVDEGDYLYYVNSFGARCTNEWRYMYGYDDDSYEESWYWFGSNGRMAVKKTTLNGKVYYFTPDGKMLTGWVDGFDPNSLANIDGEVSDDKVIYCDHNGERVSSRWMYLFAPHDEDLENQEWYYFSASGKIYRNTKKVINGKSYIFDEKAEMLSGWVKSEASDSEAVYYEEIDMEDNEEWDGDFASLYYTGSPEDGAIKKRSWIHTVPPGADYEDIDLDRYWYYAGSDGTLYVGNEETGLKVAEVDKGFRVPSGRQYSDRSFAFTKKVGSRYYIFDEKGRMQSGLVYILNRDETSYSYPSGLYYFGDDNDGWMKTGYVKLVDEDYDETYGYYFYSKATGRGQGITGIQSNKLFINGLQVIADYDSRVQVFQVIAPGTDIDGSTFLINDNGAIRSGRQTADNGKVYYADKYTKDNGGVDYKITMDQKDSGVDAPVHKTVEAVEFTY